MTLPSDRPAPGACETADAPVRVLGCLRGMRRAFALPLAAAMLAAVLHSPAAWAEKADRTKPMVIEADKPATADMQRQVVVFSGNVQIVQGTLQIRADRVEVREARDGFRSATATSAPGQPVTFRQKRDGVEEFVEGNAERIDFDGRVDTVRLSGNAQVRRVRGAAVADEISGQLITWDNTTEVFNVEGSGGGSRVRAVLSPREARPTAPASAPSAPPARGTSGRP